MSRYLNVAERIAKLERWSIEALGLRSELARRYNQLHEASAHQSWEFVGQLRMGQLLACSKYEDLENAYFADPNPVVDSIAVSLEAGWIGTHDKETPKVLNKVRAELISIYRDVRDRVWKGSREDQHFAREVVDRVNRACDLLFSITGPDETAWIDWIANLSEAGRVIKDRAFSLAKAGFGD